jgi:F0F1-type ATP synthase assembly protein I
VKPKKNISEWHETLSHRLEGTPREAARFYNLEIMPRMMYVLSQQKEECSECAQLFNTMDNMTQQLTKWLKEENPELKNFQTSRQQILRHLHSSHQIVPKGLWLSRIVVMGLIAGIIVAWLSNMIFTQTELKGLLISGATAGSMIGWVIGKLFETRLRKQNKIF